MGGGGQIQTISPTEDDDSSFLVLQPSLRRRFYLWVAASVANVTHYPAHVHQVAGESYMRVEMSIGFSFHMDESTLIKENR